MEKQVLVFLAMVVSVSAMGQVKKAKPTWSARGFMSQRDTSSIDYVNNFKDSVATEIVKETVGCAVFRVKGDILIPCDSLIKQHYVKQHYSFQYTETKVKGLIIEKTKPAWVESFGTAMTNDYVYYYNGKRVYPLEIYNQPILKN